MSRRRRAGFAWLGRVKRWQVVAGFLAAAATLGTLVGGAVGTVERSYGILAQHFGWARETTVVESFEDLKAWQLYSDIRRIKRQLYDMPTASTDRERERLEDLTAQLATYQSEYERIKRKRH